VVSDAWWCRVNKFLNGFEAGASRPFFLVSNYFSRVPVGTARSWRRGYRLFITLGRGAIGGAFIKPMDGDENDNF